MKKQITILSLSVCLVTVFLYGQEFYIHIDGHKQIFEVSATKMLVKSETLDAVSITNAMRQTTTDDLKNIFDVNNRGLFMVEMQSASRESLSELREQWNSKAGVIYTSPVFIDATGREIGGLTNQILVRLKSTDDYPLLRRAVAGYQIKSIEQCSFDKRHYLLTLGTVHNIV